VSAGSTLAVVALVAPVAACAACAACAPAPPPTSEATPAGLERALADLRADPDPAAALAAWRLPAPAFRRILVEPYRDLAEGYTTRYGASVAPLAAAVAAPGALHARRHFAGDPRLTPAELHLRWAVPPLYPSLVVDLAGTDLDAVFLHDGERWRVVVGIDPLLTARIADPACAHHLDHTDGRCAEIGWMIADRALRIDHDGLIHACALAATACSP
jgi:hypothetical protein